MAQDVSIKLKLSPELDVRKINILLRELQTSLGSFGSSIKEIDASKLEKEFRQIDKEIEGIARDTAKVTKDTDNFQNALKNAKGHSEGLGKSVGSWTSDMLKFTAGNLLATGLMKAGEEMKSAAKAGIEFQAALADFSALTGVSGKALEMFGTSARNFAKEFGTTATAQIESFKGILSRLGPDIAKSPAALDEMARAVNTLSKASGMDAKSSMDALTTTVLQFGISLDDPKTAASEMTRIMNVMAAGAKEGAAEIPQVTEAITVTGVAAKQAKLSIEETNASIQVLAMGGKYGAEAGIALRNVLSKLAGEDVIPKDALAKLNSLGVNMNIVSDTSRPFAERLKELGKAQKDATAFAQVFGTENASAASVLVEGAAKVEDFTKKLTGTNTAFEQAKINQATFAAAIGRIKAQVADVGLELFKALEVPLTKIFDTLSTTVVPALTPMITALTPVFAQIVDTLGGVIGGIAPIITGIITQIAPVFPPILDLIKSLQPALEQIMTAVRPFIDVIINVVKQIIPLMIPLFKPLGDIIVILTDTLGQILFPIIQALMPIIVELQPVITTMIVMLAELMKAIMPLVNLALTPVVWLIEQFAKGLTWLSGKVQDNVKQLAEMVKWVIDLARGVGEFLGLIDKKQLKAPLNPNFKGDVKEATDAVGNLTAGVKKLPDEVKKPDTTKLKEKVKKDVKSILDDYEALKIAIDNNGKAQDLAAEKLRLLQGRDKSIVDEIAANDRKTAQLKEQSTALDALLKKYKVITDESGTIVGISPKVKDADKTKLQKDIYEIKTKTEQSENSTIELNLKVGKINEETKTKLDALKKDQLKYNIELGIALPEDYINLLNDELAKLNNDSAEIQAKYDNAQSEAEKEVLNAQLVEKADLIFKKETEIAKEKKSIWDKTLKDFEDNAKQEMDILKKKADDEKAIQDLMVKATETAFTGRTDAAFKSDADKLKKQLDDKLITQDVYDKKSQALEKKHQSRLAAIKDYAEGALIANEMLTNLTILNERKAQLEKEQAIAKEKADKTGDLTSYNNITKQLEETQTAIDEKGNLILQNSKILQTGLFDIFSNLVSGDPEQAKSAFKKIMNTIVGEIEKLLMASIIKMVLTDKITDSLGMFAPLAKAALFGVLSGVMNAWINPFIGKLLSFSTGGRLDSPTAIIAGDASQSRPGSDTEWILRDDQIRVIIQETLRENQAWWLNYQKDITPQKELDLQPLALQINNLAESINQIKPYFKENAINASNIMALVQSYEDMKALDQKLYTNRISETEYFRQQNMQVLQVRSYAGGSGFISQPQMALVGDAGVNNPEIVLNSPQLAAIISQASMIGNKTLEGKLDRIYDAIEHQTLRGVLLPSDKITDEVNRENNRRKYK